jgi:hypothetical protein
MITNVSLSKHDSEPFDDPHLYRTIVGALQYAPITRPDIAFAVNKVSKFMHLRIGLPLSVYSDTLPAHSLMAFHFNPLPLSHCTPIVSDADWAGRMPRRPTFHFRVLYLSRFKLNFVELQKTAHGSTLKHGIRVSKPSSCKCRNCLDTILTHRASCVLVNPTGSLVRQHWSNLPCIESNV